MEDKKKENKVMEAKKKENKKKENKKMEDQIETLINQLEAQTGGTVFNMAINSRPTSTPTLPWLLEKQHVLIRKPAADLALQVRQELMQFDDWGNGIRMMNTQTGNDTWFVLFSQMKKIKKDLKKKDKSNALGRLFGVLLFATEDDTWLADNEMYEEKEFLTWFPDYSQAWKKVLEETDQDLGLALEGGKEGGYRSALLAMIKSWQREINPLLDDLYNNEDALGMNLKIDIVDDTEGETGQDDIECDSDCDNETGSNKGTSGTKKAAKAGSSSKGADKGKDKVKEEDEGKGKGKGKGRGKRKSSGD